MKITVEQLEQELALLKRQREQLIADVNATSGGIQFAERLLAYIKSPETELPDILVPPPAPEAVQE